MSRKRHSGPVARGHRRATNLAALLSRFDGTGAYARIANLSYGGCELRYAGELNAGEAVSLAIPRRGRVMARVRWARGGRIGTQFV